MPNLEFWFSGYAIIPFAGFLFALVLTALGVGPVLTKAHHRRIVWSGVAIMAALTWWQIAKQEEEKAKPGRDYVYFIASSDPRLIRNGQIGILSVSSGILRDVEIAIQKTEDRDKGNWNYAYYNRVTVFAEGIFPTGIFLPPGDWTIDLDPPTILGKVLERIQIEKEENSFVVKIHVVRKSSQEVLIPTPETTSIFQKALVALIAASFVIFSGVLAWASWVAG